MPLTRTRRSTCILQVGAASRTAIKWRQSTLLSLSITASSDLPTLTMPSSERPNPCGRSTHGGSLFDSQGMDTRNIKNWHNARGMWMTSDMLYNAPQSCTSFLKDESRISNFPVSCGDSSAVWTMIWRDILNMEKRWPRSKPVKNSKKEKLSFDSNGNQSCFMYLLKCNCLYSAAIFHWGRCVSWFKDVLCQLCVCSVTCSMFRWRRLCSEFAVKTSLTA